MEAVKGVIFGRDKIEQGYKYLVGFVLITDEPLDLISLRGETVIMGTYSPLRRWKGSLFIAVARSF